ncbi:MAG: hypothetical protein ACM34O_10920 [Ignavibacteria bacterium]
MATFTEIKKIRLTLADPAGFINIIQVATSADLPTAPAQQTLYNIINTGGYVATTKTSGAVIADYKLKELYLSDSSINEEVTAAGSVSAALPALVQLIIAQLAAKRLLVRTGTGAESKEYTTLGGLLAFYNDLYKKLTANNNSVALNTTGKWYKTHSPEIAGGEI